MYLILSSAIVIRITTAIRSTAAAADPTPAAMAAIKKSVAMSNGSSKKQKMRYHGNSKSL